VSDANKQHPDRSAPTPLARGELGTASSPHSPLEKSETATTPHSPSNVKGWQSKTDGVDVHHINQHTIVKKFTANLPHNPRLKDQAKALRKAGVLSEVLFWQQVHKKKFYGIDFNRQCIIGNYIVDFYIPSLNLVIEIDGSSHDHKGAYDEQRHAFLEEWGLCVYRINDADIKRHLGGVMHGLEDFIVQQYGV